MHGAILSAGAPLYGRARGGLRRASAETGISRGPLPSGRRPRPAGALRRVGRDAALLRSSPSRSVSTSSAPSTPWCSTRPARCTWSRTGCFWRRSRRPRRSVPCWTQSAAAPTGSARLRVVSDRPPPACRGHWRRFRRWACCVARRLSGASPARASGACIGSTTRSCGCGSEIVAPGRTALAQAARETRLEYWRRHRAGLEAQAWEELCRMAVPFLHRSASPLADLGPWEPAQRYWRRNEPEYDVVARSVDGRRLLIGEAKSAVAAAVGGGVEVPSEPTRDPGGRRTGDRAGRVRAVGRGRSRRGHRRARDRRADGVRRAAVNTVIRCYPKIATESLVSARARSRSPSTRPSTVAIR